MSQPIIDIGILTIREDEFRAVLKAFPNDPGIYKGRHREYTLRTADAGQDERYRLAILRQNAIMHSQVDRRKLGRSA